MANQNTFQQPQGFGVQPQNPDQWDIAARMAALPDTGLTNRYMNAEMPEGGMVSGHFVAPSITQNMAAGLKQAMGGQMYQEGTAARKALVDYLRNKNKPLGSALDQNDPVMTGGEMANSYPVA